jgi:uncharacterized protein (TIGR02246 family)
VERACKLEETVMSNEIRAAIESGNRRVMEAIQRRDAAGLAALYTAAGQVLPPGSDLVSGKEKIEAFWRGAMNLGIARAELETVELQPGGDHAVEVGRYTLLGEDGQTIDKGKYLVVWKQEGGGWKLHRDIWNSNLNPAAE